MAVEGRWRNICNSQGISEGRREGVQPLPYEISLEIVYQTWMRDGTPVPATSAPPFERIIIGRESS